jgi:ligand-binding SRPBCC domain-containing protein
MGHLVSNIHINAPLDKVVEYTHDPRHWANFMVGMSEPDKITGEGGVGSEVKMTVVLAGLHMHETVRTLQDRRDPDGSAHWHAAINGPSSGWMTWDYTPENGGTLVTEEWEYTLPGSALGKVANRFILEKMQERDTRHSLEKLKLLMEESPR